MVEGLVVQTLVQKQIADSLTLEAVAVAVAVLVDHIVKVVMVVLVSLFLDIHFHRRLLCHISQKYKESVLVQLD